MLPQGHEIPSIFGPSAPTMRELHVSLNYPDTNVKKKVCRKNVYMRHCSGIDREEGIKNF